MHYAPSTEEACVDRPRELVGFHRGRHPRALSADEVTSFLDDLAVRCHTSASTRMQALCALVFLSHSVLEIPMQTLDRLDRAQRGTHLPSVRSRREVDRGPLGVVSPLDR